MAMFTDEQVKEMLAGSMPKIKEALTEEILESAKQKVRWAMDETVSAEVKTFMAEEIGPEIRAHMIDNKPALLAACIKAADDVCLEIAKAMVASVQERLEQKWERGKILEAIFKG